MMKRTAPTGNRFSHLWMSDFVRRATLSACALGAGCLWSGPLLAQEPVAPVPVKFAARDDQAYPYTVQAKGTKVLLEDLRMMGTPAPRPTDADGEGIEPGHGLPGNGGAPRVGVVEPVRTLKVGESQIFTFTFSDPENDPMFAGVVGFLPQPALDGRFFSKNKVRTDRSRLGRAVEIDILPSPRVNTIVWRVTALRPGTAVFLLVATELFARVENDQLKLFAGNLSFEPVSISVTDGDGAQSPAFNELPSDLLLRRGEALTWTATAQARAARPLTYGYGLIGFAGQITQAKFSDNALRIKAAESGKAVMIGYVTDGLNVESFARRVTVQSARVKTSTAPTMRALSANVFAAGDEGTGVAVDVTVYGEMLTAAAQAMIVSERGDRIETRPFRAASETRGLFTWTPKSPGGYTVWLTDAAGRQITGALPMRAVGVNVTGILRVRQKSDGPVTALLVRGQGLGNAPTILLDGKPVQVRVKRSLRNRLNQRVLVKVPPELQTKPGLMVQVVNEAGLTSDMYFLPLSS